MLSPIHILLFIHEYGLTESTEKELLYCLSFLVSIAAVCVCIGLQFLTAYSYGRYAHYSQFYKYGMNAKIAWFTQELPSLLIPIILLWIDPSSTGYMELILCSFFILHYAQRTLIYPFLIKGGKDTPLVLWSLAVLFLTINGYMQIRGIQMLGTYPQSWFWDARFILGTIFFLIGMIINIHSDHILRNLRRPGDTGYKIPRGGMFTYVSGANFLGEIIEWFGFALAVWSPVAASFSLFTLCNIGPRAFQHHKWYHQKFDNYPVQRKALIPFLL